MKSSRLALADKAVRLSPSDPEAHHARAVVLSEMGLFGEAVKEFERAVSLRPRDYTLWLKLGFARDQNADHEGASSAFREAVSRAPYYAQPRWHLGEFLLRAGRQEEAFAELRRATGSDPALLPAMIDLAWRTHGGDARRVQQAIQPRTAHARLALGSFFVKHDNAAAAVDLFHTSTSVPDQDMHALLTGLLAAREFGESYRLWAVGRDASGDTRSASGAVITDGGFENPIVRDDPGFGWRLASDEKAVYASLDTSEPHAGTRSLRLDCRGDFDSSTALLSQLVLVEPKARYQLRFAARTQEVVAGGLPMITVTDVSTNDSLLAQSKPLPGGTTGWQSYAVEFAASETTNVVLVAVRRETCADAPCPIFGRIWFDEFSLQKSL
ncbi:MAG: tetratricopeptide repeat protein [Acidobacteriota bacterium]|nr:tetratricopeptide repeat protein [Acidobacteriota bacterium]